MHQSARVHSVNVYCLLRADHKHLCYRPLGPSGDTCKSNGPSVLLFLLLPALCLFTRSVLNGKNSGFRNRAHYEPSASPHLWGKLRHVPLRVWTRSFFVHSVSSTALTISSCSSLTFGLRVSSSKNLTQLEHRFINTFCFSYPLNVNLVPQYASLAKCP